MKQNDSLTEKQRETFHLLIYFEQFMLTDIYVNCGHAVATLISDSLCNSMFSYMVGFFVCSALCGVIFRLLTQIACSSRLWTVLLVVYIRCC